MNNKVSGTSPILDSGVNPSLVRRVEISVDNVKHAGSIRRAILIDADIFGYEVSDEEVPPKRQGPIINPNTGKVAINGAWSYASVIDLVCPPKTDKFDCVASALMLKNLHLHLEESNVEAWRAYLGDQQEGDFEPLPSTAAVEQLKNSALQEWSLVEWKMQRRAEVARVLDSDDELDETTPQQMADRRIRPLYSEYNSSQGFFVEEPDDGSQGLDDEDANAAMAAFITDIRHYCDANGYDFHKALNTSYEVYLKELPNPLSLNGETALERATSSNSPDSVEYVSAHSPS